MSDDPVDFVTKLPQRTYSRYESFAQARPSVTIALFVSCLALCMGALWMQIIELAAPSRIDLISVPGSIVQTVLSR